MKYKIISFLTIFLLIFNFLIFSNSYTKKFSEKQYSEGIIKNNKEIKQAYKKYLETIISNRLKDNERNKFIRLSIMAFDKLLGQIEKGDIDSIDIGLFIYIVKRRC